MKETAQDKVMEPIIVNLMESDSDVSDSDDNIIQYKVMSVISHII
jgi:hypothetical protein